MAVSKRKRASLGALILPRLYLDDPITFEEYKEETGINLWDIFDVNPDYVPGDVTTPPVLLKPSFSKLLYIKFNPTAGNVIYPASCVVSSYHGATPALQISTPYSSNSGFGYLYIIIDSGEYKITA